MLGETGYIFNISRHVWAWIIGGVCALAALIISIIEMFMHFKHAQDRKLRKHTLRILFMVPLYALNAYCGLLFKDHIEYFNLVREAYEAVVIYAFYEFLVEYLGGHRRLLYLAELENPDEDDFYKYRAAQRIDSSEVTLQSRSSASHQHLQDSSNYYQEQQNNRRWFKFLRGNVATNNNMTTSLLNDNMQSSDVVETGESLTYVPLSTAPAVSNITEEDRINLRNYKNQQIDDPSMATYTSTSTSTSTSTRSQTTARYSFSQPVSSSAKTTVPAPPKASLASPSLTSPIPDEPVSAAEFLTHYQTDDPASLLPQPPSNSVHRSHHHMIPLSWIYKEPVSPQRFVFLTKIGTLQYVPVQLVCCSLAFLFHVFGSYTPGLWSLSDTYGYLAFIINCSQMWAMYCLFWFYHGYHAQLEPCKPLWKALCIKGVVFFTFWQYVAISIWSYFWPVNCLDYYDSHSDLPVCEDDQWNTEQRAGALQNFLVCIEMFIFAILHMRVFSWREFRHRPGKDERPLFRRFVMFFSPSDLFKDIRRNVRSDVIRQVVSDDSAVVNEDVASTDVPEEEHVVEVVEPVAESA